MKPFNLEAALRGEKVVTRDGREVTQLTHFKGLDQYPLYGVIENKKALGVWSISGQWFSGSQNEIPGDLFMATKMKKISYRFYRGSFGQPGVVMGDKKIVSDPNTNWVSDILEVEIEDND